MNALAKILTRIFSLCDLKKLAQKSAVLAMLLFSISLLSPSALTFASFQESYLLSTSVAEASDTNTDPSSTHGFDVFKVLKVDQGPGVEGSTSLAENIKASAEKNKVDIITAVIFRVINILMLTIGTAAFISLFVNGVKLVTANGDEGQIDSAKNAIVPTLLGLVITFLAYYIVTFFQSLFYSI